MKYRLLNEVLIEWNESFKGDSANVFLKSEDIKRSLDKCFIYKLNEKGYIKIFDENWSELEKYRDNVRINSKHVELDDEGWTVDKFKPGEYKVYIEDIDKITDTESMFYGCEQLVSAFIPNSVTSIGDWAFSNCSGLMSVEIPDSVTYIGYAAFEDCTGLTSVTIPNSVTSIGQSAFYNCIDLTSITIPNSVTEIGSSAFFGCSGLTSVTIPNSITTIDGYAFSDCKKLETVYVEDINKFKQIQFKGKRSNPARTNKKVKVIELKK